MVSATVAACLNKRQTLPGLLGLTAIVLAGFEVEKSLSKYYEFSFQNEASENSTEF